MKKPILAIRNVLKKFKGRLILNNINLDIYKGEIFGLLGKNGAGKTTLIQTLLGLVEPDSGSITYFGKSIDWKKIHQRINFVATYTRLPENLTIMENLITYAKLYDVKNYYKRIRELSEFLGIQELIQRNALVMTLSTGEQTRVILCKALLNNPGVLFLDEPTASLDPVIANKINRYFLELKKKITIFYTSHNVEEAQNICDRIAFIKNGQITNIIDRKNFKQLLSFY